MKTSMSTYRLVAPSRPDTPWIAREWVVLVLRTVGLGELVEAARLCTSEVVTNAHRHSGSDEIGVEVALADGGGVTVYVYDSAPERWPSGGWGLLREGGRGLGLLGAYADDWAAVVVDDTAKAVWFRLGAGGGDGV
ncbi:ATP-binding protein [Streptomyces sp. NPDC089799]|uniref:ATP-binding protein n=1 Tax=Streptomyces sp. NPDC089799 TaxID=3155066 RepID=UPI00341B72BC